MIIPKGSYLYNKDKFIAETLIDFNPGYVPKATDYKPNLITGLK